MRRRFALQCLVLMTTGALGCGVFRICRAQSVSGADAREFGAVVAKAPTLTYPAVARMAHVVGDVALFVRIRNDGSVESVIVRSGPPLLRQAAVDNARASQFDCRGCSEPVAQYFLVYTFQLTDAADPCAVTKSTVGNNPRIAYPRVMRSPGHVMVIDETGYCDDIGETRKRVRAAKCLYLWRCGSRYFNAEDKVRSIKSLFLWKCAYHRF